MSSKAPKIPEAIEEEIAEATSSTVSFLSKNKTLFMGIAIVFLAIAVFYVFNYAKGVKDFIMKCFSKPSSDIAENCEDVDEPLVPKPKPPAKPEPAKAEANEDCD